MLINGIWAYAVLEALVIACLYILYLHWVNRRLKRRTASPDAMSAAEAGELPIDHYVELLQEQILDADAKLAQLADHADSEPEMTGVVAARLAFLRAERQASDNSATDRDEFWAEIRTALTPFLPDTSAEKSMKDQARLITALQTRIQAYETRVANLEQFRTNFFELKEKYAGAIDLGQQLHSEVGKALGEDDQPPELRDAMQKLQEENTRLEGQLSLVEQEFDNIMRNLQAATDRSGLPDAESGITTSMDNIGEGVEKIRGVIATQEDRIQELTGIISELKLELTDKERLEGAVNELKQKHTELTGVIAIIQEENDFLQEQISTLLKQELDDRNSAEKQVDVLTRELEQQRASYAELEKKYAASEPAYLAAYEENNRLKGCGRVQHVCYPLPGGFQSGVRPAPGNPSHPRAAISS